MICRGSRTKKTPEAATQFQLFQHSLSAKSRNYQRETRVVRLLLRSLLRLRLWGIKFTCQNFGML